MNKIAVESDVRKERSSFVNGTNDHMGQEFKINDCGEIIREKLPKKRNVILRVIWGIIAFMHNYSIPFYRRNDKVWGGHSWR